jgi:hypothetical protein
LKNKSGSIQNIGQHGKRVGRKQRTKPSETTKPIRREIQEKCGQTKLSSPKPVRAVADDLGKAVNPCRQLRKKYTASVARKRQCHNGGRTQTLRWKMQNQNGVRHAKKTAAYFAKSPEVKYRIYL